MKLAITGASGFIGRHVALAAALGGHEIIGVPHGEISRPDFWQTLVGCDVVCHLAACVPDLMADTHPQTFRECFEGNALLTVKLLRAAQIAGVRRFVNFSSGNAYAAGIDYPDEASPLYPSRRGTPYLASKVAQEIIVDSWIGMETCSLRLSSVFGPGQSKGMLPRMIRRLMRGETVVLENGGAYGADYVSVHDVARVTINACESHCTGPVNVGSGYRAALDHIAKFLVEIIGCGKIVIAPPCDHGGNRGFHALNISRAVKELGFVSRLLDPALVEYVAWLREHGDPDARQSAIASPSDRAPNLPAIGGDLDPFWQGLGPRPSYK